MAVPARVKMGWLELARGLAALLVVISHGSLAGVPSQYFPFIVSLGTSAVAFFFVLSGSIILHINGRDLGRPDMAANYAWRRVVRIFPTYWLVFTIDLSLHLFVGNRAGIAEMGLGWIVHEALLLPGGQLYVSVAWTLRHELLFYGLFLVAILNRRAGALLFGCWFAIILDYFVTYGWEQDLSRPPLQTLTSPLNLCFFLGMAIAAFHQKWSQLFMSINAPAASLWFGAVSYPLYLVHLTIYFAMSGVFKRLGVDPSWLWRLAGAVVLSLAVAYVLARWFERPVLEGLRRLSPDPLYRRSSIKLERTG